MFAEDLTEFLDAEEHATSAVYTAAGGSPTALVGIFDNGSLTPFGVFEDQAPFFTCPASQVPSVAQGDVLVIGLVTYKVKGSDPDGTGLVRLKLQKQ